MVAFVYTTYIGVEYAGNMAFKILFFIPLMVAFVYTTFRGGIGFQLTAFRVRF